MSSSGAPDHGGPRHTPLTVLDGQRNRQRRPAVTDGSRAIELRVPARAEQLALVRAITGTLASYEDLDDEAAANLALAVDEACTVLISMATADATLLLVEELGDHEINVRVSTACDAPEDEAANVSLTGFSRRVLEALTDEVRTFADGWDEYSPIFGIALTTRRRWASAPG